MTDLHSATWKTSLVGFAFTTGEVVKITPENAPIHKVGAGPLMRTLLFLDTIGPIEPHIWGKMCPQNQFFRFQSDGMGFFEEKT